MKPETSVRVDGVVLGPRDDALAGVAITASAADLQQSATSDQNGHFDLGLVPAGEITFAVTVAGAEPWKQTLSLAPGQMTLRVSTTGWIDAQPGVIEGVIDGDAELSKGLSFSAKNLATGAQVASQADEYGRFELTPIPSGTYRIRANRGNTIVAEITLHVGWLAREPLRFNPEAGFVAEYGFLNGRVAGPEDEPLAGATIRITNVQTDQSRVIVTADWGGFEEKGLPVGIYRVEVLADNQVLIENRILLHPFMVLDISTVEGMHEGGAQAAAKPVQQEGFHTVTVFYGTDRKRSGVDKPGQFYSGARGVLELGKCEISIPLDHELGELESPAFWRFEFNENPEKHVVLLSVQPRQRDAFVDELRGRIADSKSRSAFVFVHGYNVEFVDAARRTGQMAYDLQFDGAPILYSWPSKGAIKGYMADEVAVEWTVPHLKEFLEMVAAESGAETVHLIAHSMGNRALTSVLREFAATDTGPHFEQIVLLAPDIDADIFKRDIAPRIPSTGKRVTLYASGTDEALKASKQVHAAPRAGEASENPAVIVPGIDTIDVTGLDSSLLGHSYFAENDSVIADLIHLIHYGEPPDHRAGLAGFDFDGMHYWRFITPPGTE